MTTDPRLRKQVIDAMIEAADIFYGQAEAALDAALDILETGTDEIERQFEDMMNPLASLVELLRAGKGSDE